MREAWLFFQEGLIEGLASFQDFDFDDIGLLVGLVVSQLGVQVDAVYLCQLVDGTRTNLLFLERHFGVALMDRTPMLGLCEKRHVCKEGGERWLCINCCI